MVIHTLQTTFHAKFLNIFAVSFPFPSLHSTRTDVPLRDATVILVVYLSPVPRKAVPVLSFSPLSRKRTIFFLFLATKICFSPSPPSRLALRTPTSL